MEAPSFNRVFSFFFFFSYGLGKRDAFLLFSLVWNDSVTLWLSIWVSSLKIKGCRWNKSKLLGPSGISPNLKQCNSKFSSIIWVYLEEISTWGAGVSIILGAANFAGDPSNKREHSVYADPMPNPAPKATEAQRLTGLPSKTHQKYID